MHLPNRMDAVVLGVQAQHFAAQQRIRQCPRRWRPDFRGPIAAAVINPHSVARIVRQMASTGETLLEPVHVSDHLVVGGRVPLRKTLTLFAGSRSLAEVLRSHASSV